MKLPVAMESPVIAQDMPLSPTLLAAAPDTVTRPILEAIEGFKSMLMVRVEHMASECTLIRHDLDKIRGWLTEAEDWIGEVEGQQDSQVAQIADLHSVVRSLVHKVDDAENRQRRNNVRVVGLPEGAEDSLPAAFAESLFKNLLSLPDMPPTYVDERAHRVPMGHRQEGAPQRPFLVQFLNFRDRDMILAEAQKHSELPYENTKVMLFPDFSAKVQKRRKSFNEVRCRLREKDIKYSMLYPSRLRVPHKGTVRSFDTSMEASDWIDDL